ncbi:hypothetical protein [Albimonas pacifica]|uniref:Uncharacterized protein n=1 Tax=Albimonas pacifica TaxID=1114924 RepID=A0A1I3LH69_9RHOB|nr:hypothetical protein [Albimonas pacifica]SFI84074.1 hypothetical protein SAMN05216258_11027 [Albimonas pacifica]
MLRVAAGQTVSRVVTVAGSGSLASETFTAYALDQQARPLEATVAITNAGTREITITVAATDWVSGNGGFGRLEVIMDDGGVKSQVHAERIRITPGMSVRRTLPFAYA